MKLFSIIFVFLIFSCSFRGVSDCWSTYSGEFNIKNSNESVVLIFNFIGRKEEIYCVDSNSMFNVNVQHKCGNNDVSSIEARTSITNRIIFKYDNIDSNPDKKTYLGNFYVE